MKERPSDHPLIREDPEEFRCLKCNPTGWNRTGRIPPGVDETDTETMWGVPCFECVKGWREDD